MENPVSQFTLRDSFAAVGLSVVLTLYIQRDRTPTAENLASEAYEIADAMIAARGVSE